MNKLLRDRVDGERAGGPPQTQTPKYLSLEPMSNVHDDLTTTQLPTDAALGNLTMSQPHHRKCPEKD